MGRALHQSRLAHHLEDVERPSPVAKEVAGSQGMLVTRDIEQQAGIECLPHRQRNVAQYSSGWTSTPVRLNCRCQNGYGVGKTKESRTTEQELAARESGDKDSDCVWGAGRSAPR